MVQERLAGDTLEFMQRLWALVHALDVRSKRMAKTIGVTGPQRLVVRVIGQRPDQTASEVAALLGMHPSTLTGVLARLEKRGAITRTTDAADRRRARFALTASGKLIDREKRGTVEAAVRRALGKSADTAVTGAEQVLAQLVEELARDA